MNIHARVGEITERIVKRSRDSRRRYLDQIEAYGAKSLPRKRLGCANFAHGFAACSPQDKQALRDGDGPNLAIVTLPAFFLLAFATAMGVGLWLSALNVKYRDVAHLIPFLIQIWMYASPIVYPLSLVPPRWRARLRLIYQARHLVRSSGEEIPGLTTTRSA